MSEHYDTLETRDPQQRQAELIKSVAAQVAHAAANAPAYQEIFTTAGIKTAADLKTETDIAALPITRKAELLQRQQTAHKSTNPNKPNHFGGFSALKSAQLTYLFASPGPIYEPATSREDYWRFARALFAAGFRRGDIVQNCFSYHLTPAGAMGDSGCHALGCAVIPAGVGQTEQQIKTMCDLQPNAYIGTPSFLKIILEAAEKSADGKNAYKNLNKAVVSGEALPPSTRADFQARGINALQVYATADLGLIAYESIADDGLILDEQAYVEIVAPGSGDPLPDGEIGEVIVTTLNPDYPLIRFATGDLSAFLPGQSQCGRTNRRLKGWLGRADQTTKVRGMFIHPLQIQQVLQRHPHIKRARLVVEWIDQRDHLTLKCEMATEVPPSDTQKEFAPIAATVRDLCKLRCEVEGVPIGTLPNDNILIDDQRKYD